MCAVNQMLRAFHWNPSTLMNGQENSGSKIMVSFHGLGLALDSRLVGKQSVLTVLNISPAKHFLYSTLLMLILKYSPRNTQVR